MVEEKSKKKTRMKFSISAFAIILVLIILMALITHFLPAALFVGEDIIDGSGVVKATLSDTLMSPILGFADAVDVGIFILIFGGFLAIVNKTKALETGIQVLIEKLKGNELILIPILMTLFSIGGTTYGMLEETVAFYAILAVAMVAARMDTIVASAIVLLGAGSGVLGSTINPFAVGAAVASLPEGITCNQGIIIGLGAVLWLTSLAISIFFVMIYAKKVKENKGSTFLSLQEQKDMEETYGKSELTHVTLNWKQKTTLILFAFSFVVMILGFIPWGEFNISIFESFTGWLTGEPLGNWWFFDAALWFFIMGIIIGIVNRMKEKEITETFIKGASDIIGVILIIAVARGASVLMQVTHLDNYIIFNAAEALRDVPALVFGPLNYLLHAFLSILIPSSSGLAALSTPIMGPLSNTLGYSVEGTVMTMVAANGLVNLITPTCGAIMGGLALAKVEYITWVKWALKIVIVIAVFNILILTLAMMFL